MSDLPPDPLRRVRSLHREMSVLSPQGVRLAYGAARLLAQIVRRDLPLTLRVPQNLVKDPLEPLRAYLGEDIAQLRLRTSAKRAMDDLSVLGQVVNDYFRHPLAIPRGRGVVIDAGANVGAYSVVACLLQPTAVVHAFEPVTSTYLAAAQNIKLNSLEQKISITRAALGAASERRTIDLTYGGRQGTLMDGFLTEARSGERQEIPVERLDDYCAARQIDHVDVLKIDVEGFEVEVLRGASRLLPRTRAVLMEWHSSELALEADAILTAAGMHRLRLSTSDIGFDQPIGMGYWVSDQPVPQDASAPGSNSQTDA